MLAALSLPSLRSATATLWPLLFNAQIADDLISTPLQPLLKVATCPTRLGHGGLPSGQGFLGELVITLLNLCFKQFNTTMRRDAKL